ncbi:GspH/FimT family pseudopilin [Rhodoferax sp.]|uniref:GspH/FimT family pseudopilin n=1 Tax=Rhodoferax sp. TaxID=50421 RepID=UPI00262E661C|nr:GspH/FimT family pseudopilin [Rhodoferax sp.]MDD3937832.1 GspH/FimT family pseudopilin [Rhodoferax sp.]
MQPTSWPSNEGRDVGFERTSLCKACTGKGVKSRRKMSKHREIEVLALMRTSSANAMQGFTLVELLVTLTIAAILLSLAVPSLASFVQSARLRGSSNELASALMFARSEAIKRGHAVTVCKSENPNALDPSCGTSATWQQGWLVFVDHDRDGVVDGSATPSDLVLRVGAADIPGLTVSVASNFRNYIQYTSNGVSVGSDKLADGNLSMCLNNKSQVLTIGTTGRLSISSGAC